MKIKKKVTDGELQSQNSEAFKFFSTSVVIQVLLTPYPEGDSHEFDCHDRLCINKK